MNPQYQWLNAQVTEHRFHPKVSPLFGSCACRTVLYSFTGLDRQSVAADLCSTSWQFSAKPMRLISLIQFSLEMPRIRGTAEIGIEDRFRL